MKQYLENLDKILNQGVIKESARSKMPRTKEIFPCVMEFNLQEGFPILTTKKMSLKNVAAELLWFLIGSTNILYLHDDNCRIWDEDCFRLYQRRNPDSNMTFEEWKEQGQVYNEQLEFNQEINDKFDCGKIYGELWRYWPVTNGKPIDQICNLVNTIINNPNSRYQIVSAWNPEIIRDNDIALPSCHCFWQTCLRPTGNGNNYIDLAIYQRSCDYMLGVPYNIASYAILVHILAKLTGNEVGKLTWIGGSTHVYENHVENALIQLKREPKQLPTLECNFNKVEMLIKKGLLQKHYDSEQISNIIVKLRPNDFKLKNYDPHPVIKYEFSSGLNESKLKLVWNE